MTVALLCRELVSARLQEAALELSLPVVRIRGLLSGCEATGGGAPSGVVDGLTAPVIARRRVLCSQLSGLVGGHKDGEMPVPDVV